MTAHASAAAHSGKPATTPIAKSGKAAAGKNSAHVTTGFSDALSSVRARATGGVTSTKSVKSAFAAKKT
jgi:hypothetical protein